MSAGQDSFAGKVFAEYFSAWEKHDTEKLEKIFTKDCRYEIKKVGVLNSLNNIEDYWRRNARRQKNVRINWELVDSRLNFNSAIFFAQFFDISEKQQQIISGVINIQIAPEDGRIYNLSETYHKEIIKPRHWAYRLWDWAKASAITLAKKFMRRWSSLLYKLVTGLIVASILIIILYLYISYFPIPEIIAVIFSDEYRNIIGRQELLNMSLPPVTKSAINNGTDNFISIMSGISRPLLAMLFALLYVRRFLTRKDVKEIKLSESNTDLDVMANYLRDASGVRVFSGSFDFLKDNQDLLGVFKRLAEAKELELVSFRKLDEVLERNRSNHDVLQILNQVINSGKFREQSGAHLNMSIYKNKGISTVLYKHAVAGQDESIDYILRVEGRRFTSGFVQILRSLSDQVYQLSKLPTKSEEKFARPKAIFVCGKINAGKSTFCKYLESHGAEIVSASNVLRQHMEEHVTRRQLQDSGMELLNKNGADWFARELGSRCRSSLVVFDGIRSIEAINILKSRYTCSIVVYIDVPDDIRAERYRHSVRDGLEFNEADTHPIEAGNESIKTHADLCLSYVGGEREACHALSLVDYYARIKN